MSNREQADAVSFDLRARFHQLWVSNDAVGSAGATPTWRTVADVVGRTNVDADTGAI